MDGRWVEWPELPSGQQWRKSAGPWATLPNSAPPTPLQQVLTREPNRAGAPIQPPRLSCCSNMFCEGAVLRGGVATLAHPPPQLVGKGDSCKARRPARQQSASLGIRAAHCHQGRLLGHWGCTSGTWPRLQDTQYLLPRVRQAGIFTCTQGRGRKIPRLEGIRPHSREGINPVTPSPSHQTGVN